ncbi:hypothetical protein DFO53_0273 [Enterobacter sp. AG5470]|nr:hypothetical protein DFO53_0273 [Enterobacter sp. AG5470]
MFTSTKTRLFLTGGAALLWLFWLMFASRLSHRAYLQADAPDTGAMMTIAALVGLLVAWRLAQKGWRWKSLLLAFSGVFLFIALTLWNAPEAWVRATASERVQSEVMFSIGHPGPPVTRSQHCEAGLRFYDAWLKRPVELCTRDDIVPPGARTVQLEKRVTARGAVFTHYRFISAAGHPQGWWPVSPPTQAR